jgi:hypothetical protein
MAVNSRAPKLLDPLFNFYHLRLSALRVYRAIFGKRAKLGLLVLAHKPWCKRGQ